MTDTLTIVAALGSALVAGALFAFSSFVMTALARLPAPQGIAAMQSINVEAPTPRFMSAFVGTALVCIALSVAAIVDWEQPGSIYRLTGSALYLSVLAITGGYHVPRNDALDTLEPTDAGAARHWAGYVIDWTRWNHVRTLTAFAAAALFSVA